MNKKLTDKEIGKLRKNMIILVFIYLFIIGLFIFYGNLRGSEVHEETYMLFHVIYLIFVLSFILHKQKNKINN